jgi:hypothetical protein
VSKHKSLLATPSPSIPGFGTAASGRAVIVHEAATGTDIPVLVVDVPSKPGPGLNGEIVDYRVAVALRAGMSPSLDLRAGQALAGWAARRLDARRVEITAGSEVFVTTKGHLPPRWLDVAAELGEVFIVYGVGVITATQAPDLVAFTAGCAAAARIAWHTNVGQKPGYHLLDLREAGFALPAFSFPADQLRARGPLEQWGFEHLGNRDPARPLPLSDRLVVSLKAGPADVDVFDVGMGGLSSGSALVPMTGMRGVAERPAWMDDAADEYGRYLLLATTADASSARPGQLLLNSWCVITRILAGPEKSGSAPSK